MHRSQSEQQQLKIAVAGASGYIGTALVCALREKGHTVVAITRQTEVAGTIHWNPDLELLDSQLLEGFDVIINLAGENISKRWTEEAKIALRESRIKSTTLLANTIARLKKPPSLFMSASGAGYYGDRGDDILTEIERPGPGFLSHLCREWELATWEAVAVGVPVNILRFGVVLSADGGALAQMLTPFRFGLGAMMGSGDQYFPWVSREDLIRAVLFLIENPQPSGAFNVTAPNPCTNRDFTKALAKALHRPAFLKFSRSMIRFLFKEMGETLFLESTRAVPHNLVKAGFTFKHSEIASALKDILGKKK